MSQTYKSNYIVLKLTKADEVKTFFALIEFQVANGTSYKFCKPKETLKFSALTFVCVCVCVQI